MRLYNNDEYREEFMELVYGLLYDDGTNDRANQIIYAFDSAPEVESEPLLPNDPLTLDELREMIGSMVQCGSVDGQFFGRMLVGRNGCVICDSFDFSDYGKTWLAYRRKPEEVEICQKTSSRSG